MSRPRLGRLDACRIATSVILMLGLASVAGAQPAIIGDGWEVYDNYALVSGDHIRVGFNSEITGDIHSNDSIHLRFWSRVDGDVSAVGWVRKRGTVTGTVTRGADPVALPELLTEERMRAAADRIFEGDTTFTDEVIDDVVFVDGRVTIEGSLNGVGALLSVCNVRFVASGGRITQDKNGACGSGRSPEDFGDEFEDDDDAGGGSEARVGGDGATPQFFLDDTTRLVLITHRDVRFDRNRLFRGAVRAGRNIWIRRSAHLEGSLIADGRIFIRNRVRIDFLSLDQAPPEILVVSPLDGAVLDISPEAIVATWSDDFSGVDPSTSQILLDGTDRTAEAVITDTGLTLPLTGALAEGLHTVEITVRDFADQVATVMTSFTVDAMPSDDTVPPEIVIGAPDVVVLNELTPAIDVTYSDDDSGVDTASLSIEIDGLELVDCAVAVTGAACEAPRLTVGEHLLRVELRDLAGNLATAELTFTIELMTIEQVVSFPLTADSLLSESAPDRNFGSERTLELAAGSRDRLVLRFDVDAVREIVGNGVIQEARLSLVGLVDPDVQAVDLPLSLHRLEESWMEDGVTWTCGIDSEPGDELPDCPAPWDGGTFGVDPVATTVADADDQLALFDFTQELQQVIAGAPVDGWLVKASTEPWPETVAFGSREATLLPERPALLVRLDMVPEPDAVDTTAPRLTLLDPAGASVFNELEALTFDYFDGESGVDSGSVRALLDGIELTCDASSFGALCPIDSLSPGPHTAEVEVSDLAGNPATETLAFELVIDEDGPVVVVTEPTAGQVVAGTALVRVSGTAIDPQGVDEVRIGEATASVAADGSFELFFDVTEGMGAADAEGDLTLIADDRLDNRTEVLIPIVADSTPPALALSSPESDLEVNGSEILVRGLVSELYGVPTVTVDGVPVAVDSGGAFSRLVQLADGANTIRVAAVDGVGNQTLIERIVTRFEVPTVRILTPANNAVETDATVLVTGEVSPNVVTVTVNDEPAALGGSSFSVEIALSEGIHPITAVASTAAGRVASDTVSVARDTTPPRLVVQEPADGETFAQASVDVGGLVLDPLGSADGEPGLEVTVAGQAAVVDRGMFLAAGVALAIGDNPLTVTATDARGNSTEQVVTVVYEPVVGARLEVVSGDRQAGDVAMTLAQPLVVRATDAAGLAVAGVPVIWSVENGDGTFADDSRRTLTPTDAAGTASTAFRLGRRAGVGNHKVRAEAAGYGSVVFRADGESGLVVDLLTDTGDQQIGATGQRLPRPLVVGAVDGHDNLLAGVAVTFNVALGGGSFDDGSNETVAITDSTGRARVNLTLGEEPGVSNQLVWATLGGDTSGPLATFSATARAAGDPADTTVVGQVLDNSDQPVPGVTLYLEGTSLSTTSDVDGLFELVDVPVGSFLLWADGSTATRPGVWPTLEFEISTIAGVANTLGRPIYLLPLDTGSGIFVSETEGGVLTLDDVPGFALEVAAGSATFPDGSRSGVVSVTSVHYDKVPMAPEMAQQPRFVVTIQPAGTLFDPPAHLTLPNMEGLPPGTVAGLFSFDHDLGRFATIGPGMVSEDGLLIQSQPGVGVVKAGWHCCQHTAGTGTPHQCGYCRDCVDDECVNASSPVPPDEDPQNCTDPACFLGSVIQFPTTAETPEQEVGNCFEEYCRSDGQVGRRADPNDVPQEAGGACCEMPSAVRPWPYNQNDECCIALGLVDRNQSIEELGLRLADCPNRRQGLPANSPTGPDGGDSHLGDCSAPFGNPNVPHGDPRAPFGPGPGTPCFNHDICYRTCHQTRSPDREICDDNFCEELRAACRNIPANEIEARRRCFDNSWLYCVVVDGPGGIGPYRRNQRERCLCC